ncbi:MAG: glycosyltransferase family 9 protein, partial [Caulobacteraceae bacterium]
VGRVDLLTAYALLKRARLFIGNDSGLMHLSAAAGAPTLGLFGPSDERLYAPWGPKARALRGPRDFETFKRIDPSLNQVVCHMFDLPTPWVTAAARKLFLETAEVVVETVEIVTPALPAPEEVVAAEVVPAAADLAPEAEQAVLEAEPVAAGEPETPSSASA